MMSHQSDVLVEVEDLRIHFHLQEGVVRAVDGVSFTIRQGKTLGVIGESGSGKTTLLRLIGGEIKPSGGHVKVADQIVHHLSRDELFKLRRKMGMLFQFGALFTDISM